MNDLYERLEALGERSGILMLAGNRSQRRPRWTFLEGRVARLSYARRWRVFWAFRVLRWAWPMAVAGGAALAAWLVFGLHAAMIPGLVVGGIGGYATLASLAAVLGTVHIAWAEGVAERYDAKAAARKAAKAARKARR